MGSGRCSAPSTAQSMLPQAIARGRSHSGRGTVSNLRSGNRASKESITLRAWESLQFLVPTLKALHDPVIETPVFVDDLVTQIERPGPVAGLSAVPMLEIFQI